jgi:hypothetical protein
MKEDEGFFAGMQCGSIMCEECGNALHFDKKKGNRCPLDGSRDMIWVEPKNRQRSSLKKFLSRFQRN